MSFRATSDALVARLDEEEHETAALEADAAKERTRVTELRALAADLEKAIEIRRGNFLEGRALVRVGALLPLVLGAGVLERWLRQADHPGLSIGLVLALAGAAAVAWGRGWLHARRERAERAAIDADLLAGSAPRVRVDAAAGESVGAIDGEVERAERRAKGRA